MSLGDDGTARERRSIAVELVEKAISVREDMDAIEAMLDAAVEHG